MTARIVVPEDAPRELWLAARGEGVTASRANTIARGGIRTWRRELEQQMNGSRFRGTDATRAGTSREAALLEEADRRYPLLRIRPNSALWAAADNDLHRATPDGIGATDFGDTVIVEVKSHESSWKGDGIPADHLAQMQWQMHVLGAMSGLYGFEVRDEDDQPPLDGATWITVPRDEEMIAWLIDRADAFIAWRAAGCPDFDDLDDETAAALAEWAPAKVAADEAAATEKTTNAALKRVLSKHAHAARFGAVAMGPHGGYQLTVSESVSIDEDAWREANPDGYRRAQEMRVALATAEAMAKRSFPLITRRSTLRFQEVED